MILRGDGTPLYNFATVVDDAQMRISHVIRAEEHLSNTPIQVLLHEALGNALPQFAHVPYVAAPGSKEKLSKRKIEAYRKNPQFKKLFEKADEVFPQLGLTGSAALDPVMVEYYEKIGYLPAAVLNALGRIGWSLDDSTEIMSLDTMTANVSLDRVVKAPAGFDPDKLYSFQGHWMKVLPDDQKLAGVLPYLVQAGLLSEPVAPEQQAFVAQIVAALGDRLKVFSDILAARSFCCDDYPAQLVCRADVGPRAFHGLDTRAVAAGVLRGSGFEYRRSDPRAPAGDYGPARGPRCVRLPGFAGERAVACPDRGCGEGVGLGFPKPGLDHAGRAPPRVGVLWSAAKTGWCRDLVGRRAELVFCLTPASEE